ncbi:MAG: putative sulfate exporter family transporter [Actinophytocola sp.]|nr:putative sulfate exporter family transporter [Actinophytocola sp.]
MTSCAIDGYRSTRASPTVEAMTTTNDTQTSARPQAPGRQPTRLLPGLLLAGAGIAAAAGIAAVAPALSALTVAVVLGVVVGNTPLLPRTARPGLEWATRRMLRVGVVLLGLQLAVDQVLGLGAGTLLAIALTVAVTFVGTQWLGRVLGVSRGLTILVATGFSICGASAIAAMEGVVRRKDSDVATAIALVTLYGSLAIVAVPLAGPLLGLHGEALGSWAGVSVHEVAQVVAAASPAGAGAVATAAVVKLSRVVLLAPLVAGVSVRERRERVTSGRTPPLVPLFVLGFLAMIGVRSTGLLPDVALDVAGTVTSLLLAGALFGLGCGVRLRALLRTGPRALLLGLGATLLIGVTGYVSLAVLG